MRQNILYAKLSLDLFLVFVYILQIYIYTFYKFSCNYIIISIAFAVCSHMEYQGY